MPLGNWASFFINLHCLICWVATKLMCPLIKTRVPNNKDWLPYQCWWRPVETNQVVPKLPSACHIIYIYIYIYTHTHIQTNPCIYICVCVCEAMTFNTCDYPFVCIIAKLSYSGNLGSVPSPAPGGRSPIIWPQKDISHHPEDWLPRQVWPWGQAQGCGGWCSSSREDKVLCMLCFSC